MNDQEKFRAALAAQVAGGALTALGYDAGRVINAGEIADDSLEIADRILERIAATPPVNPLVEFMRTHDMLYSVDRMREQGYLDHISAEDWKTYQAFFKPVKPNEKEQKAGT